MVRSVEASFTRLQTDRIDLYWVHMADGVTPIEEIVRGFDDLVRSGKILYAGLSNFPASGKYRAREEGRLQRLGMLVHTEKTARATAILDAVLAVAGEIGTSPTHVAIAWLLHKAAHSTTSLIPILGSRTRAQLDATLSALDMRARQSRSHALMQPVRSRLACRTPSSRTTPHGWQGGSWNAWTSQPFRWCERCRMPTDAQEG